MVRAGLALLRGARLRCPACGAGHMSRAWWTLAHFRDTCGHCGIPYTPGRGESIGGVEIVVYVSALVGLLSYLAFPVRLSVLLAIVWVTAFGALLPLVLYRHGRGVWIGTMYAMRPWGPRGDPPRRLPDDFPHLPWDD